MLDKIKVQCVEVNMNSSCLVMGDCRERKLGSFEPRGASHSTDAVLFCPTPAVDRTFLFCFISFIYCTRYFSPYTSVRLGSMAEAFGMEVSLNISTAE